MYIMDQRKDADELSPSPSASNPEENATTEEIPNAAEPSTDTSASSQSESELDWSPDEFHERLSIHSFENIDDVERYYSENFNVLIGNYGVLLFMYTVLMTKVRCMLRFATN